MKYDVKVLSELFDHLSFAGLVTSSPYLLLLKKAAEHQNVCAKFSITASQKARIELLQQLSRTVKAYDHNFFLLDYINKTLKNFPVFLSTNKIFRNNYNKTYTHGRCHRSCLTRHLEP